MKGTTAMRQVIFSAMLPIAMAASTANPICAGDHEPAKNAALQYWSALVYIPDSPRLTEWEVARYDPLTTPLDDAKFLLNGAGIDRVARWSLEDLRRGAKSPYCEWGLAVHETGPFTRLHHTQRAATAAGLLILSARVHHANGNWQAAIEDLNAAWVFALHLGNDGTLISWGIHFIHIDRNIAPLAASWVPDLDISAVEEFEQCLRRLPAPQTFADVLKIHGEQWLHWLRGVVRKDDLESIKE
jgi:hypothetical protein